MMILLSSEDIVKLSSNTRNELLGLVGAASELNRTNNPKGNHVSPYVFGDEYKGIDMEGVYDLTLKQIEFWMLAAKEKTKRGLKVFADKGPVIKAQDLIDAGITNISHFQSRTTIRTRTVTGDSEAFMLGWDDWEVAHPGEGRYGVTPITHASLKEYFKVNLLEEFG